MNGFIIMKNAMLYNVGKICIKGVGTTYTLPRGTTNYSAEKALYKLRLYNRVLSRHWHARLQCYVIREPPLRVMGSRVYTFLFEGMKGIHEVFNSESVPLHP